MRGRLCLIYIYASSLYDFGKGLYSYRIPPVTYVQNMSSFSFRAERYITKFVPPNFLWKNSRFGGTRREKEILSALEELFQIILCIFAAEKRKSKMNNNDDIEQRTGAQEPEGQNAFVRSVAEKTYEYGFTTDVETEVIDRGLTEDTVRLISQKKGEPDWLLELRKASRTGCWNSA